MKVIKLYIKSRILIRYKNLDRECFNKILKKFTYRNVTYDYNVRNNRSILGIPKYLKSYSIDKRRGIIAISRGGIYKLKAILTTYNYKIKVIDKTYYSRCLDVKYSPEVTLRSDQQKAVRAAINSKFGGLIRATTSFGKCHAKGTEILMYDGSIKKVEDVEVGNQLMGPDSKPRNVLSLGRGQETMYRIKPLRGEEFTVNESHILSFKVTGTDVHDGKYRSGDIHNIAVKDYILLPKYAKHLLKLWSTGVEFRHKNVPFEPYFIGLYLAEGRKNGSCQLTINDNDIALVEAIHEFHKTQGDISGIKTVMEKSNCTTYRLTSMQRDTRGYPMKSIVHTYLVNECVLESNQRCVPKEYLINSKHIRLQLLAGLLDGDGYLEPTQKHNFEICVKDYQLHKDVLFLSRSVGLHAVVKKTKSRYKKDGVTMDCGHHYRIQISGATHIIPTKLTRKQAAKKLQRTNSLLQGFTVEKLEVGSYYGFTIDGDHLYLMGNFMVTHNTIVGLSIIAELGKEGNVLVWSKKHQQQWYDEILKFKFLKEEDIGGVGGIFPELKVGKINIIMQQSVAKTVSRDGLDNFVPFKNIPVTIVDEGQKYASKTFSDVINRLNGKYRFSVSADFNRSDKKQFLIHDAFGKYLYIGKDEGSDSKIPAIINLVTTKFKNRDYVYNRNRNDLLNAMTLDRGRNDIIISRSIKKHKQGKLVLIMLERKEHVARIAMKLKSKGYRVKMLMGDSSKRTIEGYNLTEDQKDILRNYKADAEYKEVLKLAYTKDTDFVIGTSVTFVGLSIKTFDHAIIATPSAKGEDTPSGGVVFRLFNQKVGRVERSYGDDKFLLDTFGKKATPTVDYLSDIEVAPLNDIVLDIKKNYPRKIRYIRGY